MIRISVLTGLLLFTLAFMPQSQAQNTSATTMPAKVQAINEAIQSNVGEKKIASPPADKKDTKPQKNEGHNTSEENTSKNR